MHTHKGWWKEYGKRIRELRQAKGLTQRDLAELVTTRLRNVKEPPNKIDFTYISKIESGSMGPPTLNILKALSKVLGIEEADMMCAAGKFPDALMTNIIRTPEARDFLRKAAQKPPTAAEWAKLSHHLERVA